jgi:pimeloyl-ACP methyl ester carboxylesterase
MDHLEIDRALFGGISMGAGISLYIALRYPERVAGLILVRPAWLARGNPANLEILKDLVGYLDMPDGEARFAQTAPFRQIQDALPQAAASIAGMFSRQQQAATHRILTHLVADAPIPEMESLAGISQPSLILGNQDDPLHPLEIAMEIAAVIPHSKMKTVTSRYVDAAKHRQEIRAHVLTFLTEN